MLSSQFVSDPLSTPPTKEHHAGTASPGLVVASNLVKMVRGYAGGDEAPPKREELQAILDHMRSGFVNYCSSHFILSSNIPAGIIGFKLQLSTVALLSLLTKQA